MARIKGDLPEIAPLSQFPVDPVSLTRFGVLSNLDSRGLAPRHPAKTNNKVAIDREKLLQSAAKLVDKKKYDKAIVEYQRIVQADPKDARTLLKIGDLQSRMLNYAGAISTYDKVATLYATQGFQLKAIAVFKQIRELIRKHAPELAPRYSHITPRLADIYAELNLITDALAAYDEVATTFQKAGRDIDAIQVFEKTVLLDPKNPLPHLRLAEARCRIKHLDEAIESFWTASELLLGLKRPDDALKVIERILHFKQDPLYARAAAQLYLQKGTPQSGMQALSRLQIAFQANPKDLDTLALLAQAFEVINQSEKALEVHLEMGRLARDQGKAELWYQIVAHVKHVAPENPGVIALEKAGPPAGSQAPPPRPPSSLPRPHSSLPPSVEVEEAVDLDADVEFLDEASSVPGMPGGLRPSRPPSVSSPSIRGSQPDLDDDEGVAVDVASGYAAEERGAPQSFQPSSHAHKALADAESFRSLGLLEKAVEALHIALEIDPNSVPIREKLREILVEAGEREGAIQETLNIAIIHIHNQDPDSAEPLALEILEIEPDHPDALNILDHVAALREGPGSVSEEGHLDSYDMEGVRPSQAISDVPRAPAVPSFDAAFEDPVPSSRGFDLPPGSVRPPPRPSLPPPSSVRGPSLRPPPRPSLPPASLRAHSVRPPASRPSMPPSMLGPEGRPTPEAIEEVLEEAEFFAAQGLYSDAEAILLDMLRSAPEHVLLKEQLQEVQARLLGQEPEEDDSPDSLLEDKSFDIAASLDALDDLDEPATAPALTSPDQEVDVDQVFAKFKEGVKAVVADSDAATHYDLGLAYKEMGLSADAISEFEIASRDPARAAMCFFMIGMIHREQGNRDAARKALLTALGQEQKDIEQEKGIEYDLALVCQEDGKQAEYLAHLKALAAKDAAYRDVSARIRALGETVPEKGAADEEDEFDAAFENLLG